MSERQVPYDLEAEEATIGALLIDPDAMGRVMATGLRPAHFYLAHLGLIFEAITILHEQGEPGDYVLVISQLRRAGHLETVGGPAALTALILRCPTSIYATHYANVVRRSALQRRIIVEAARVAQAAYACNGTPEDLAKAMARVLEDRGASTDDASGEKPKIGGVLR